VKWLRRGVSVVGLCAGCGTPTPPQVVAQAPIIVEWVNDGAWHYCEMALTLPEAGQGSFSTACRGEEGPLVHGGGHLGTSEVYGLRQLLGEARLFGDKSQGQDMRGLDYPLMTLRVTDGEQVASVVCSLNETLRNGARLHLVQAMWALEGRTS